MKRPEILGAVAGRFTNTQQMIGNNDPDISALGVHVHNMAMANSGVHGFRSQEGVESYERQLLNNFKNGPAAMAGALRASTGSVQTFIDNARPDTYKTHTKNGGAVRWNVGGTIMSTQPQLSPLEQLEQMGQQQQSTTPSQAAPDSNLSPLEQLEADVCEATANKASGVA